MATSFESFIGRFKTKPPPNELLTKWHLKKKITNEKAYYASIPHKSHIHRLLMDRQQSYEQIAPNVTLILHSERLDNGTVAYYYTKDTTISELNLLDMMDILATWKSLSDLEGITIREYIIRMADIYDFPLHITDLLINTADYMKWA